MKRHLTWVLAVTLLWPFGARAQDDDAPVALHLPPQRYAYAGAGVFLLGGIGFSYWARGQAERAETIASAREASEQLREAKTSAATANVLYTLAGLTLAYGLVLELLPEQAADKADLTFHF